MRIRTYSLAAAALVATLGFVGSANAQSATGVAYGKFAGPTPKASPATPAAPAVKPASFTMPAPNLTTPRLRAASPGINPYNAGNYFANPYTAGVPNYGFADYGNYGYGLNNGNTLALPNLQLGTVNGYPTVFGVYPNVYGYGNNLNGITNGYGFNNGFNGYNGRGAAFGPYRVRW